VHVLVRVLGRVAVLVQVLVPAAVLVQVLVPDFAPVSAPVLPLALTGRFETRL